MAKKLNKKDLVVYRELLLQKLAAATGDIQSGTLTGAESKHGHHNPASGDTADQGAEAFEQDFALSILENEANVVQEIDEALDRIEDGTYGICAGCEKPVPKMRLKAIPWARLCIDCQRKEEAF